ncbi:MAG: MMPL family transporter [bacterium]|nr:MMPL family transporter [bacterium]
MIGGWCFDNRWTALSLSAVAAVGLLFLASGVRFDNSFESYFAQGDPTYAAYLDYRDEFGSDEVSYILYRAPDQAEGAWNLEVMRKIAHLTEALEEEVPFIDEVTSLTNVEFMDPVPGGIEIDDLLEEFPATQQELLAIREKVLAKPLYVGALTSRDGRHAGIIIEMDRSSIDPLDEIRLDPEGGDGLDNLYPQVSYQKIQEILARPAYQGIHFYHSGDVPLNAEINIISVTESAELGLLTAVIIAVLLLYFFRSPLGVAGPLAVVGLSILVVVALVGSLGWMLDLMFGMLPTLLIAVGVADSVHIISEFRTLRIETGDRREAARRTLYLVGAPCLLTSLTTAVGFGAMATAPIKTLSHFAVYSAVGVVAAFLFTVTLLMVFLSFGRRELGHAASERELMRAKGGRRFQAFLKSVANFDIRHRRAILVVSCALTLIALAGITRIQVDSNFLNDFSEEVRVRQDALYADSVMGGTNSYVYLFETEEPEAIKDPAVLREIERLQEEGDRHDGLVMKSTSIVDVLKDINQTFHDGDPAYYAIPETRELVAQYLLLYEMSGGEALDDYVSSDYSRAALDLRCKWTDTSLLAGMERELSGYLERHPIENAAATLTGVGSLWIQLMDYITTSQIRSLSLALIAIAIMLCLLFRSVRLGMLAMVPNVVPVAFTLGVMGWFEITLDYVRLLIAPVAIGIAVDYSIHLVSRYRHEFLERGRYREALAASLSSVGRALVITTVVLVAGFLTSLRSDMDSQASFGILLAGTIVMALIANFLLMPALVLTFRPFGPEREIEADG